MSRKILSVELSREDAPDGRFYYANIDLPVGMKALLDDACQQARFQVDNLGYREITVTGCADLPQLTEIRLDSPTLEELNYLAYRIGQLSEIERVAMQGVVKRCLDDGAFDGIVGDYETQTATTTPTTLSTSVRSTVWANSTTARTLAGCTPSTAAIPKWA